MLLPSFSSYSFAPLSHFHTSASYFSRFVLVLFSLLCFSLLFTFLSPCLFLIYLSVALPSFSLYEPIPFFTFLISLPIPFSFSLFPLYLEFHPIFLFFPLPSSTSFYHFSEVFALITTKFIFPAVPQRPLVIDYSSLQIGICIKSYIYVTALHTKIIQAETLNMGEYISRFKRHRFPAEVLLSALKEWPLFFSPNSTHSRTGVFVSNLIVLSLRSIA